MVYIVGLLIVYVCVQCLYVGYRTMYKPNIADHNSSTSVWRALLIASSPYASACLPCGYKCALGHTLHALQHVLLVVLLVVAVASQLQLRSTATRFIGLSVAALVAVITQPIFNMLFYASRVGDVYEVNSAELLAGRSEASCEKLEQDASPATRSKRRSSVYIVDPLEERQDGTTSEDALDINALYEDSDDADGSPIQPLFLPTSNEEVSSKTGSCTDPGPHEDLPMHLTFGDFADEENFGAREANGAATLQQQRSIFDMFEELDEGDGSIADGPQTGGMHDPDKVLAALVCLDFSDASEVPRGHVTTTGAAAQRITDFDRIAESFDRYESEIEQLKFETGVHEDGEPMFAFPADFESRTSGRSPMVDFDTPVEDQDARRMFAPDGGLPSVPAREPPSRAPPAHLLHLVDMHRQQGEPAQSFLDSVLDDVERDENEAPAVAAIRHESQKRNFIVASEADAWEELSVIAMREWRVAKALEPSGITTAVDIADGTLRVSSLLTYHSYVTIAYAASCVLLLAILYGVLSSADATAICGNDVDVGQQVLLGLVIDVIIQCLSPGIVYLYRVLQSDELDDLHWELHPFHGQERAVLCAS